MDGETLTSRVQAMNPFYGNAFLGLFPDNYLELALKVGAPFEAEISEATWPVRFGKTDGDVARGAWVAFAAAADRILSVRNHDQAVDSANRQIGDGVKVRPWSVE